MAVIVYGNCSVTEGEMEGRPWYALVVSEPTFDADGNEIGDVETRVGLTKDQYKKVQVFDGDKVAVRAKVDPRTNKLRFAAFAPKGVSELLLA